MEVQDKLHSALLDKNRMQAMHTKRYSMVSYVWSAKYQQSNQRAIEALAVAMESSIRTKSQAQVWGQRQLH